MKNKLIILFIWLISLTGMSQQLHTNIRGNVKDVISQQALAGATIIIKNSNPLIGTTTDLDGNFILKNILIGRYDIEVSYIGYETLIIPEIILSSAKDKVLSIELKEQSTDLNEVVVKPKVLKESPLNPMAVVSARMLSVEEANRYAGGYDDPARLAASFPGVASTISNNSIVIRGNAPKFLQWKIEGVEIPNPNHFANLSAMGGGGLTAFSSNMLANSDFFTSAFPAEYNNALSGVFDMKLRSGNNNKHEHSIELGVIGLGFASEGPISKNKNSSYIMNYRYSTLGLISSLLPEDAGKINYQDLSFKLKFPSPKGGKLSVWGIGLIDNSGTKPEKEENKRNYYQDIEDNNVKQFMGAFGLSYKKPIQKTAYWSSHLAITADGLDLETDRLDNSNELKPQNLINSKNFNMTFKSFIHKKFSNKHYNRSGITLQGYAYDLLIKEAHYNHAGLLTFTDEKGEAALLSAFSSSTFNFSKFRLNIGINTQYFSLNKSWTIEPRIGLERDLGKKSKISFGYGLHSRMENLNVYFANTLNKENPQANKNLGLSKSHHLVLAFDHNISDKLHLKIEPYFQYLFNIPIVQDSTLSLVNLKMDWFINDTYINKGKGINYGIDFTLEQYIQNGFYYLVSASLFNSKYKTESDIWYNTRYNKNYIFNLLFGKEYRLGKRNNLLGINFKLSTMGGDRYSPIDEQRSLIEKEVVYNESNPFSEQAKAALFVHFTLNYEWYKKKSTHRISLKLLNATNHKEFQGHRYNYKTNQVEELRESIVIPNISYKISF